MTKRKLDRGFEHPRGRLKKGARYICSCNSCYYNGGVKDTDCANKEVTKFDMVDDDGRVFCTFWRQPVDNEE